MTCVFFFAQYIFVLIGCFYHFCQCSYAGWSMVCDCGISQSYCFVVLFVALICVLCSHFQAWLYNAILCVRTSLATSDLAEISRDVKL